MRGLIGAGILLAVGVAFGAPVPGDLAECGSSGVFDAWREPARIRFLQWNIGHFALGWADSTAVKGEDSAQRSAEFRAAIARLNPDFIGVSEFEAQFDKAGRTATNEVFAMFPTKVLGPKNGYTCNAQFSRFRCIRHKIVDYKVRKQLVYFIDSVFMLGTNEVHVVQSHLDWHVGEGGRPYAYVQMEELVEYLKEYPLVIIAADFNVSEVAEYKTFVDAGYTLANGGPHGHLNTFFPRKGKKERVLDNIVVKGFAVKGIFVDDYDQLLGDHRIFGCDLELAAPDETVPRDGKNTPAAFALADLSQEAYTIVVPEKASPSQRYAAEELCDYTIRVTGVQMPIVTDAAPMPKKAILLGRTKWTDALLGEPFDWKRIGTDGFRLAARPPHLLVLGAPDRGTLYGVYELLERFAGCRWYASWHTVVPRLDRIAVPNDLDEVHMPAFAMREPYWYDVTAHPAFAARLRVNSRSWRRTEAKYGGEPYRFGGELGSCHTFDMLLPARDNFDAHPEYFSMVKGKRVRERTQLCLTNPDVLRIVTSNVLERIRKDPGAKFYGVSQNDCYNYCECPGCKAVDDEEGSHAGTMVRFVNAVAEEVEKEFPDAIIETLAYQYTRNAPKKTRLRRNVVPCLCSIECDFALPIDKSPYKENAAFRKDIEDWSRLTDFLYVWDYTTDFLHYALPWPNVHALQGNIRFFRRNNVKALYEQGAHQGRHADFAELKAWLLSKWMWNPDLPMGELLDDFFFGYYGRGAPFVREYFEKVHQLQARHSSRPDSPLLVFDDVANPAIPDSFLEEAAKLWDKAAYAAKDDPKTSYNVRMGAFSVDYARFERSYRLLGTANAKSAIPREKLTRIAQSLLDRMAEAKDIRLSEVKDTHERYLRELREFLAGHHGWGTDPSR